MAHRRGELEQKLNQPLPNEAKEREVKKYNRLESQHLRLKRTKIRLTDFRTVKIIGKGAFGEVKLVQKLDTGKVYAMKTLQKVEMLKRDQVCNVLTVRDVRLMYNFDSLPMSGLSEMFWPNPRHLGSCNSITHSKIQHTSTSSWNSFVSTDFTSFYQV